jgi:Reverse transcriptase-like
MKEGLQLAWQMKFKKLIVETNSTIMYEIVEGENGQRAHEMDLTLIQQIKELLSRKWKI